MSQTRLIHCTFEKGLIREPLLYNLGRDFKIVPNIRGATINDDLGLVYLELEGPESEIDKAVAYLKERGVKVDQAPGGMPAEGLSTNPPEPGS